MNPIVNYIDLKTPFGTNIPLVQKRLSKNSTRNFNDKQEFIDHIDSIKPSRRVDTYLVIKCSCEKEYEYKNKDEVPSSGLVCGCKRVLLKYGN